MKKQIYELANLYGVQTSYRDVAGLRHWASKESLLAVLKTLGAPIASPLDLPAALRERRQALCRRILEPVTVLWTEERPTVKVQLPQSLAEAALVGYLEMESGERRVWRWSGASLPALQSLNIEGTAYVTKNILLPEGLAPGYHRFRLEARDKTGETLIIAAPSQAYSPPNDQEGRLWGVFLPLYALNTGESWGSGEFTDLEALIEWVASAGGNIVTTLPLLPTYFDNPFELSPYIPVSRRLWSEFYLNINKIPDLGGCAPAQTMLASQSFQEEINVLRNSPLIDYPRQMALKRRVLEELCRCLFADTSDRLEALQCFVKSQPVVEDYARFRAVLEKQRLPWRQWPQPLRDGAVNSGDYDEEAKRYHIYAQWLAHEQVQALYEKSRRNGTMLYLDLPLGVHPNGYDAWRERSVFGLEASTGAPPDTVFTKGQDWQFPPLHPENIREQGYRYTIAYLRHHLQYAGILRIDHVMGFHRLFWIPSGLDARQGVYVRYRAEEFYAILALESQRSQTTIVGEDLGTVPPYVRPAMRRHGLHRMYVLHYELASSVQKLPKEISHNLVASLNTHDMPPFASFWQALDIEERRNLGLLDRAQAQAERRNRRHIKKNLMALLREKGLIKKVAADLFSIFRGCLAFLSTSQARIVLINLEDLWQETQPQNVPSTRDEYPNWRRKARYRLEEFCQMPEVRDTLRAVDHFRRQDTHQAHPEPRNSGG